MNSKPLRDNPRRIMIVEPEPLPPITELEREHVKKLINILAIRMSKYINTLIGHHPDDKKVWKQFREEMVKAFPSTIMIVSDDDWRKLTDPCSTIQINGCTKSTIIVSPTSSPFKHGFLTLFNVNDGSSRIVIDANSIKGVGSLVFEIIQQIVLVYSLSHNISIDQTTLATYNRHCLYFLHEKFSTQDFNTYRGSGTKDYIKMARALDMILELFKKLAATITISVENNIIITRVA